eukprot:5937460-Amphidinium_carterae.1
MGPKEFLKTSIEPATTPRSEKMVLGASVAATSMDLLFNRYPLFLGSFSGWMIAISVINM